MQAFCLGEHLRFGCQSVEVYVGLAAAIVIGIACRCVVASHAPFESVAPLIGIIIIAVVGINRVESHQTFEIDSAGPDIGFIDLLAGIIRNAEQWVRMFLR